MAKDLKIENQMIIKKIFQFVNLIGLDKITAKTIPIKVKLGETVKFGLLEIKVLKMRSFKRI